MKTLYDISPGRAAAVETVGGDADIRRRLHDLGFAEGAKIKCVGVSPLGNMKAFFVCGAVIALRKNECEKIQISPR